MTAFTIADLDTAKLNLDHIGAIATSPSLTSTDRLGNSKKTLAGFNDYVTTAIGDLIAASGYQPPIAYTTGIVINSGTKTVEYLGDIYAPILSQVPFTTSGTFETTKFRVIQGSAQYVTAAGYGRTGGNTVQNLVGITPASGYFLYQCVSYFNGYAATTLGPTGGGLFVWDSSKPKSAHNGGTIISPTVPWNGSQATLAAFLAGTGETATGGNGCWVRVDTSVLMPTYFGAVPDNVNDCYTSIKKLFDYVTSIRMINSVGTGSGTTTAIHFPWGKYKLSATLPVPAYSVITADRACIVPTLNNFTMFSQVGYATRIKGFVFLGGQKAIGIASGGVDGTTIDIEDCEFYEQTVSSIETDNNSASTTLNIKNPKIYNTQSGAIVFNITNSDKVNITGGTATVASILFKCGSSSTLKCHGTMSGMICTPQGGNTVWTENWGTLTLRDNRFGGEISSTICHNYATIAGDDLNALTIVDNQAYCGGRFAVRFFAIPNKFRWDNIGMAETSGFFFDASIPDLLLFRKFLASWDVKNYSRAEINYQGNTEAIARVMALDIKPVESTRSLIFTDKVAQCVSNTATGGALANTNITTISGMFGQTIRSYTGANPAHDGTFSESWSNQLTGLPSGVYTAVYNIQVASIQAITIGFYGSDLDMVETFGIGKYVVCVPFYFNSSTSANRVGIFANYMNASQNFYLGNIRVFKGNVKITDWNNMLAGSVAPTTGLWGRGDRIIDLSNVSSGGYESRVCTVSGTPGTWATSSLIS